ncbi:hypothetical protein EJB05_02200, partial [Eragrostis curvula]
MVHKAECAVCLEGYEAGETLRTMPCSHGFHERCIFGWLRVSRLCPLCRFAMPAETEEEDGAVFGEVTCGFYHGDKTLMKRISVKLIMCALL